MPWVQLILGQVGALAFALYVGYLVGTDKLYLAREVRGIAKQLEEALRKNERLERLVLKQNSGLDESTQLHERLAELVEEFGSKDAT